MSTGPAEVIEAALAERELTWERTGERSYAVTLPGGTLPRRT